MKGIETISFLGYFLLMEREEDREQSAVSSGCDRLCLCIGVHRTHASGRPFIPNDLPSPALATLTTCRLQSPV
jgi:hypothetical protein